MGNASELNEELDLPGMDEFTHDAYSDPDNLGLIALSEGNEKDITSPGSVQWDTRKEVVEDIGKEIEKQISPKWDIYENSRLIRFNNTWNYSLSDIKRALIPYYKKGWFMTISLPDHRNDDVMLTYNANVDFLSQKKYGNPKQHKDIFVRFYAREPSTPKYMRSIIDLGQALAAATITISVLCAGALFFLVHAATSLIPLALMLIALPLCYSRRGVYVALKRKKEPGPSGPLLWIDDIQQFITANETVRRNDRISRVLECRVLPG